MSVVGCTMRGCLRALSHVVKLQALSTDLPTEIAAGLNKEHYGPTLQANVEEAARWLIQQAEKKAAMEPRRRAYDDDSWS